MTVIKSIFDEANNITLYMISNNSNGLVVGVIDYGATLVKVLTKDRSGQTRDIVLGFDDLDGYQNKRLRNPYFGATIGRVANRIANGNFNLNDQSYQLPINSGTLTIHGGSQGFDKRKWTLSGQSESSITLSYTSEDGEEGFPACLQVNVTFTVTEDNQLQLVYCGKLLDNELNKSTIINLTNHSYFNLNGANSFQASKVLDHKVRLFNVDSYLEVNETLIPTGKFVSCKNSNFDFNEWHSIGERTEDILPNGYDHCFVLEENSNNYKIDPTELKCSAKVYSSQTGIQMTMFTTEPGFQFYAGSKILNGHLPKNSQTLDKSFELGSYSGFCLEAQRFPDAIHQENWINQVLLKPGQTYKQTTIYKFESLECNPK